jgi:TRAP-type mannitol/chloroaromatic compound transport system permease large subunit
MFLGLDGVELSLIIVFLLLFSGIMSGYPVAFAIGGAALIGFGVIAILGDSGILLKEIIDTRTDAYRAILDSGVDRDHITIFNHPELPKELIPLFDRGADGAFFRTLTFIVNRMNERVLAGQSIETLLAVAMFVLMGITLERSRIAEDLLTTMARVFGPLPGGLAVSVVVVGAFLAASTGIVGATVVTMGLLSLPTMLRRGYSPELATGVISASGTLGQIIPPSVVIVLLGTLAGDIYATAQENRAKAVGCSDALTFLGDPAVLSVGTLFQAAIIPGIFLAVLYGLYAFGYALLFPDKAPPVHDEGTPAISRAALNRGLIWYLVVPAIGVVLVGLAFSADLAGPQSLAAGGHVAEDPGPELRTRVSDECKAAMIELHGQEKWDRSVAAQVAPGAGTGADTADLTPEEAAAREAERLADLAPLSEDLLSVLLIIALVFTTAYAVAPLANPVPLFVGGAGVALMLLFDFAFVHPTTSPGTMFLIQALPTLLVLYGLRAAMPRLSAVEIIRVVFPPLVLIIAVLGSILGGITNPTPAAALGAAGAIMLAAHRKLAGDPSPRGRAVLMTTLAIIVMLLVGLNFDLRTGIEHVGFENWVGIFVAAAAYHLAFAGFLFACWVLLSSNVLGPVVRDTAKVTSMVFTILIGSQMLNLVIISFGGEEYIQSFLRSFDDELVVFLFVMLILFVLGFVLDFLEIIYIVIPIVGPVIYGGTLDPKWVTIMIAVNLQTSFLTPPFGFALFYLRGVAPPSITTAHIYRGVVPFVIIQVVALALLWLLPEIATWLPDAIGH